MENVLRTLNRCDERLASKGEPAPPGRGETFSKLRIDNSTLKLTSMPPGGEKLWYLPGLILPFE